MHGLTIHRTPHTRDLETSGVLHLLLGAASTGDRWGLASGGDGAADSEDDGGGGDGGNRRRGRRWKKGAFRRTMSGVGFSSLAPLASAIGGSGFCSGYTVSDGAADQSLLFGLES